MKSQIGFYGGVGSVTGANFLLDTGGVAIAIDCGLEQGSEESLLANAEPFVYNPADVDVLVVTHAHADHIGRIPKLVKDGFTGVIYSTPPTRDLAAIMLHDALSVMEYEYERYGRQPIYDGTDITKALSLWKTRGYHEPTELPDQVTLTFTNAGHILGSAMAHFTRNGKKVVFTGDIGNVPQPLLAPPEIPTGYDYLVMESVYGDRKHEQVEERAHLLAAHIERTRAQNGTLIIPAFSLERSQGMLLEINNMIETGQIRPIPVFLDSPLAIEVTEVYRRHAAYLSPEIQEQINGGDDIFDFSGLEFTKSVKESYEIDQVKGAKIIIAGSGMSHGGRIRRHEQIYLDDPHTTLLLVGYQSAGSIGRILEDGARKVTIDGKEIKVRAAVAKITGYSGHADRDQLVELVAGGCGDAKGVFVVMGEERSSLFLTQRLRDYLGVKAKTPDLNEEVEIDF